MLHLNEALGVVVILIILVGLILRAKFKNTPIWTIMAFAAFVTIAFNLVNPNEVEAYVDWNVILFLTGMFSLGAMAEESGLLEYVFTFFTFRAKDSRSMLYTIVLLFGLLSAVAVNDAVAVMGSTVIIPLARAAGLDPELAVLALAFAVTVGSTMTPIGNPQNMLIAVQSGVKAPLTTFLLFLGPPTIVNLLLTAYLLEKLYRVKPTPIRAPHRIPEETIRNRRDAYISGISLLVVLVLLAVNDYLELKGRPLVSEIGVLPFTVAAATYVASSNPREVIRRVSWSTVLFFIVMFIAMGGVWNSGVMTPLFQAVLPRAGGLLSSTLRISLASLIYSQLLSNVPFTDLFIPYMHGLGFTASDPVAWVTLAMATTIAGNLTILGAASNVIILESIESRYNVTVSYWRFMRAGAIVTLVNVAVYLAYIIPLSMLVHLPF
ncbi:MAG: SLC13 family permease [Acidilobus sp.]